MTKSQPTPLRRAPLIVMIGGALSFGATQMKKYKAEELFNADPKCKHIIKQLWSGIKCTKCSGWFCY